VEKAERQEQKEAARATIHKEEIAEQNMERLEQSAIR
jgi:hypothetical protein